MVAPMPLAERGLGCGDGDAAVGDVARGMDELAGGESFKQRVQVGFGIKVERRRRAPEAAENHLGVLGGAEGGQIRRGFSL